MRCMRIKSAGLLFTLLLMFLTLPVFAGNSGFEAGKGTIGNDDGPYETASFHFPRSTAVDKEGIIYVADTYNNLIRILNGSQVKTYAGICDEKDNYGYYLGGYVDGPLSEARFNKPSAIVFDSKGSMFVLDTGNHSIRKISGGMVYTFAGSGSAGYKDGRADDAWFNNPLGMTIDKFDNLYVADSFNNVIRKVDPSGMVTTFAGIYREAGGFRDANVLTAEFNEPSSIVVNDESVFYVADTGNQLIRKISNATVTTFAGDIADIGNINTDTGYVTGGFKNGPADLARFNFPKALALDPNNNLFIADSLNRNIRVVLKDGEVMTFASGFENPVGVMVHNNILYAVDMYKNKISMFPFNPDDPEGISDDKDMISQLGITGPQRTTLVFLNGKIINFSGSRPVADDNDIFIPLVDFFQAWEAEIAHHTQTGSILVKKGNFARLFAPGKDNTVLFNNSAMITGDDLKNLTGLKVEWSSDYNVLIITGED